jgi:hypothetical protein
VHTIRPVHLGDRGAEVSNLHKGLLFIIFHEPGISPNDRETLRRRLATEVRTETFGAATADLVGILQNQLKNWPNDWPKPPSELSAKLRNLRINGDVDDLTAEALNWLVSAF